ncbi:MAG TPA: hypothetical protein VIU34_37080 [Steroidobacter sp.]
MSEVRAVLGEHSATFSLTSLTPDDPCRRVELTYAPKRDPIILQINRCDGTDPLGIEERNEFLKVVEARESPSKHRIVDQIANARYIFAIDVPEDLEDEGDQLCGALLMYLQASCEGLIQIDGMGFFEVDQVAMALEPTFLIRARALASYRRNPKHGLSIELSAPVAVQDTSAPDFAFNNGSPYIEVDDPLMLATLDKIADTTGVLSDYLHENDLPPTLRGELSYGVLSLRYDEALKQIFVQTVYDCSRELTRDELKELIQYTRGQWSDGAGSGIHQGCSMEFDMAPGLMVDKKLVRVVTRRRTDITAG